MNSFIHLFKTPGGHYMYDVNKNVILSLSEEQYKILNHMKDSDDTNTTEFSPRAIESIEHLRNLGFLSEKRPKEMYHPLNDTILSHINNKVNMITLQITKQCNLRCKYCVYSGDYENRVHSNKKMTLDIAKKGIDFYIENSKDNENAFLAFYGGEPLLEFEFIQNCIEYFEKRAEGKNIHMNLTTNATLITEEIVDYFQKHNVFLLISLDGSSEVHNKNRVYSDGVKGTFEKVMENLEMIKTNFPNYLSNNISFNAVLDPHNDFKCVSNFFTDFELVKEANIIASEISNLYRKDTVKASEKYVSEIEYENFKIYLSKLGLLDEKYTSKLLSRQYNDRKTKYNLLKIRQEIPDKIHHGGPCVPGVQRLFVDVEGNFYPCEKVSEESPLMKIGNIEDGFDIDKIKTLLNIGKLSENKCINCWALTFCDLCVAAADGYDGLSAERKVSRCSNVKNFADSILKDICTLKEFGAELGEVYMKE